MPPEDEMYNELINTTQSYTPAKYVIYHPPVKDEEHNTDALRCIAIAIHSFNQDNDGGSDFVKEMGWAPTTGKSPWKPAWG